MEPKRRWHLALILTVIGVTIYNILPTLFYYANPLQAPISKEKALETGQNLVDRVDQLETDAIDWLNSFSEMIGVSPLSIAVSEQTPDQINLRFAKLEEANAFRNWFPRAGSLIPAFAAQMGLCPSNDDPKQVSVFRRIPVRLSNISDLFEYVPKMEGEQLSSAYQMEIEKRKNAIEQALADQKIFAIRSLESPEQVLDTATSIASLSKLYDLEHDLAVQYAQWQSEEGSLEWLVGTFERAKDALKNEKTSKDLNLDRKGAIEQQIHKIDHAQSFIKKHPALFSPRKSEQEKVLHPFFAHIAVNEKRSRIELDLSKKAAIALSRGASKQLVERLLVHEMAKVSAQTKEKIEQTQEGYTVALHKLEDTTGLIVFKLDRIGQRAAQQLLDAMRKEWHPTHPDLSQLKIVSMEEYKTLPVQEKALCLIVCAPIAEKERMAHLSNSSLYVIARGFDKILQTYAQATTSDLSRQFQSEFRALSEFLAGHGFSGYRGSSQNNNSTDLIFECRSFYSGILSAAREEFAILGDQTTATLELSNVEQRILAVNQIEGAIHADLIKWDDEYRAAQVSLNPALRYDIPKPTKSVFWNNVKLTAAKFWRGDDRKILRWGLDLSGGKTIEIELRDQNNRVVQNESDVKQGINELFNRVNKMGVSDVSIRKVGNHIVLDFPGGQALSASDLVKASSMVFHIVNEKFGPYNPLLANDVQQFLQGIWNEALVTNRKTPEQIQEIAYRHLYGDDETATSQSDVAKHLIDSGLALANPDTSVSSDSFDTKLSKVALLRDLDPVEWHGQMHPLVIVFHHRALEGAELDHIRANYDSSKGNYLTFEVNGSNAKNSLYAWTSQFSKESIAGTAKADCSYGRGWRMAVLLNGSIISAPTLESALRDSASISGNFSQREIGGLVSDLKAGSLTFTPHILSEKNVSPELGKSDRMQGITATFVALAAVIVCMLLYYRFAGLIASIAVLFNLLIMWATLQNLGASLSLASIAGIILTVGMAVDANVLVFERMKEEFATSGRIAQAIRAGYDRAFSAILDSNVTTIIAALILLNFDAGPIKAFAVSMIIGIASSMFTALFMTRFYFNHWVQNPKHKALSMANWIQSSTIDFLKMAKPAFFIAISSIVIGSSFIYAKRSTLFGMDFTGGYAVHIEVEPSSVQEPLFDVQNALTKAGARHGDFQIRQHNPATHLRLLFSASMEQPGRPFANMALSVETQENLSTYKANPRLDWVVQSLEQAGIHLTPHSLASLDSSWTSMSGQMSESMRNNALLGLLIAFISIFFYIAWRFEYKYAISTILCLLHDVLITLGFMGILHAFGVPVQIDLNTVAALMTIIGYSLNDTIIIFDRVREDIENGRALSMRDVIFRALNATLSRTAMTSGTTLVVLLALLFLGGASIFSFSLVMVIGVVFGTMSSWFIAAPLLLFFDRKENARDKLVQIS